MISSLEFVPSALPAEGVCGPGQAGFGHKKGNYLCKKRTSTHLDERRENRRTVTVAFIRYITS